MKIAQQILCAALAAALPNAQVAIFKMSGHDPFNKEDARVFEPLSSWLDGVVTN